MMTLTKVRLGKGEPGKGISRGGKGREKAGRRWKSSGKPAGCRC